MSLEIVPMTVKQAKRLVKQWHRKLPDIQGGLFAVGVRKDGEICGVAIAGNPARVWQGTGRIVISRVAAKEQENKKGVPNACSRMYGALCRAADALGYREAWTYTLPSEPGSSPKGAGFELMGLTDDDADHSRKARPRKPPVVDGSKLRWRRVLRTTP